MITVNILPGAPTNEKGKFGGVSTYTALLEKALRTAGLHPYILNEGPQQRHRQPDILLLAALGADAERRHPVLAEERVKFIKKYQGEVPVGIILHDVRATNAYAHTYRATKDLVWDFIITVDESLSMLDFVKDKFHTNKRITIRHPFVFDDKNFANREESAHRIVSISRLAMTKRTHITLNIAERLHRDCIFYIYGHEGGMYHWQNLKDHPAKELCRWPGRFKHYTDALSDCGFMIDLTFFQSGKYHSGGRTQYTVLEAIDCGVIPIGFDLWKWKGGYEGVWLPDPKKISRSYFYDDENYANIIRNSKYDFKVAQRNRDRMKEVCSLENIGNQFKRLFESL